MSMQEIVRGLALAAGDDIEIGITYFRLVLHKEISEH
jgi:hypothetical protein